jgi:hypothetical protein
MLYNRGVITYYFHVDVKMSHYAFVGQACIQVISHAIFDQYKPSLKDKLALSSKQCCLFCCCWNNRYFYINTVSSASGVYYYFVFCQPSNHRQMVYNCMYTSEGDILHITVLRGTRFNLTWATLIEICFAKKGLKIPKGWLEVENQRRKYNTLSTRKETKRQTMIYREN